MKNRRVLALAFLFGVLAAMAWVLAPGQARAVTVLAISGEGEVTTTLDAARFGLGAGLTQHSFSAPTGLSDQFGALGFTNRNGFGAARGANDFLSISIENRNDLSLETLRFRVNRGTTNRTARQFAIGLDLDGNGVFDQVGPSFRTEAGGASQFQWDLTGLEPLSEFEVRIYGYGAAPSGNADNDALALDGGPDPIGGAAIELVATTIIPVPPSMALLVVGLGGLVLLRRRHTNDAA